MTDEKPNGEAMLQRVVDALKVKNEAEVAMDNAYKDWSSKSDERAVAEEEVSAAIKELTAAIDRGDVVLEVVIPEASA